MNVYLKTRRLVLYPTPLEHVKNGLKLIMKQEPDAFSTLIAYADIEAGKRVYDLPKDYKNVKKIILCLQVQ